MPYQSLAEFLEELERDEQLARVEAPVDAVLEVAEITERVARRGGPALLFTQLRSRRLPLVSNLLGSEARICRALGIAALDEIVGRLDSLVNSSPPAGWLAAIRLASSAAKPASQLVKSGPCQQVVRLAGDVDLAPLPLLWHWTPDPARAIPGAVVISRSAANRSVALDWCWAWELGTDRLGLALHPGHAGWRHLQEHRQWGQQMPVAVIPAGHPVDGLAALAPRSVTTDPWGLASFLRGHSLELVKCRSHDLEVPADAEMVIEGAIDPSVAPVLHPAAEWSGQYGRPAPSRVVQVTAITERANAVLRSVVPGRPPNEHTALRAAMHRLLMPWVRAALPEIVDYHLPDFAGSEAIAVVAIRKCYAGQARKVAAALSGRDGWGGVGLLIVVDEGVDVANPSAVLFHVAAHADPARDLFFPCGPPMGTRNPWGEPVRERCRATLAIDATRKWAADEFGPPAAEMTSSAEMRERVTERWREYGLKG